MYLLISHDITDTLKYMEIGYISTTRFYGIKYFLPLRMRLRRTFLPEGDDVLAKNP
jgi:hypothetical protein